MIQPAFDFKLITVKKKPKKCIYISFLKNKAIKSKIRASNQIDQACLRTLKMKIL
jgi:hypothetical protein